MANYNNGHFIAEAIESVRAQTHEDWELVIVDDCSTDGSVAVIESRASIDPRIRFFRNERNRGVGYTKRKAVDACRGEIVGIVDSDDAVTEDALSMMWHTHNESPAASLCWSEHWVCDELLNVTSRSSSTFDGDGTMGYMQANPGEIHHFWTFRRDAYKLTEGFNDLLRFAEDQDLFYKLEEVGATHHIDVPLYRYRHHSGSTSIGGNTARAFACHLIVMCAALKRRGPLLSAEVWSQQSEAVRRHYDNFLEWGATNINILLAARLQQSISYVTRSHRVKSVLAKAIKFRIKNALTVGIKQHQ